MQDEDSMIADMAAKHGVSEDGVRTVYQAMQSSGGKMAQFSHPDFGGMSQWSGGMTMVGDMFNDGLKAKLNALCQDLANYIGSKPADAPEKSGDSKSSSSSSSSRGNWWPDDLGSAGSTGSQNQMRYAIFPDSHRLVVDDNGSQTVYDTGDHRISGISQSQSSGQTLTFTSQSGNVKLSDLDVVKDG